MSNPIFVAALAFSILVVLIFKINIVIFAGKNCFLHLFSYRSYILSKQRLFLYLENFSSSLVSLGEWLRRNTDCLKFNKL